MKQFLMRWYNRALRWLVNPAPSKIDRHTARTPGNQRKRDFQDGRPIEIELGFLLYKSGAVSKRSRRADGERRIDSLEVKQLVYNEYDELLMMAKAKHRRREWMRKILFRSERP